MVTLTKEIKGVMISENDEPVVQILDLKEEELHQRNKFNRPYVAKRKPSRLNEFKGTKPSLEDYHRKRQERNELRGLISELKEDTVKRIDQARKQRELKKQQKEINANKNLEYQVITDNRKIRKWSKKAREKLMKMPADHLERYLKKSN
jgi:hypothetical protein